MNRIRIPEWIIALFFFFLGMGFLQAQGGVVISGPETVIQRDSGIYFQSSISSANGYTWVANTGTLKSNTFQTAVIQWDVSGSQILYFNASTNGNYVYGSKNVYVSPGGPDVPNATISKKLSCGKAILTRSTLPPSGVTWYWQSSPTGESVSSSGVTVTLTSGTEYYLRARDSKGQWSTHSQRISYSIEGDLWYADFDGDGFGDPNTYIKACSQPPGYVANNKDKCPDEYGENSGCPVVEAKEDRNWLLTKTYNILGQEEGKSKSYYNAFGKMEQSQAWDKKTDSVWASEVRYDSQGRPKLATITAPIKKGNFLYKPDFLRREDGHTFSASDYDNNLNTLVKVGEQSNSLGWYYSNKNTRSKYQDVTDYPYAKTIYSKLIPGETLRTLGGNKKGGDWKQGYSFTMLAGLELTQSVAFNESKYGASYILYKKVVRDINGIENVIFEDGDGNTLAAARSGGERARTSRVSIGEQGYVDIHVPSGSNAKGFTISKPSGVNIKIYDLITELPTTSSTSSLGNGFYRIAVTNLDTYTPNTVTVNYKENYYDYSLNKYDKSGRLTHSYQPLGKLESIFKYNSLGQLEHTKSPDEGEAWFKYRNDGQIRYSQNSKQRDPNADGSTGDAEFSYTNYDAKGRPVESGVLKSTAFTNSNPDGDLPSGTKSEQQHTTYDKLNTTDQNFLSGVHSSYGQPGFLAGNVAKTSSANSTTYYSYDVYGRVSWMVQKIDGLGTKTIDYTYDPITSEVLRVDFQKHTPGERFIHEYTYNTVGQLVQVKTGASESDLKVQAAYKYYETGALKRKEIGNGLQGMDYVYTLGGALKSINHPDLTASKDPGGDANDLFGMTLHYNSEDYQRSGTPKPVETSTLGKDQYNGNIKGIEWKTHGVPKSNYYYDYNRNNWLTSADFNVGQGGGGVGPADLVLDSPTSGDYYATNSITLKPGFVAASGTSFSASIGGGGNSDAYRVEGITYDANGNILKLKRHSGSGPMDDLSYNYKGGKNQLDHVEDAVTGNTEANDIKDQSPGNYSYNAIGQLIHNGEDNTSYTYNAAGLVTQVTNGTQSVRFTYDDKGKRLKKEVWNGNKLSYSSYYIRDAAGSVLGIYTGKTLEHPVYGSSRIGVAKRSSLSQTKFADNHYLYELTDHLGNVRAVAKKDSQGNAIALVKTDYYPFGMPMPGRDNDANQSEYRYKYQGQEKDAETGMEAFELRLWGARIGRWLTTDPAGQYSSPYLGMGNNPVRLVDLDGAKATDEWGVDANGNLTWVSGKGGDQIQYFNFKEGHDFEGQTGVALGNFDSGLTFVDLLNTSDIDGGIFSQFGGGGFGNESIINFYTDRASYNGNSELVYHPLTGEQVPGKSGALKENNIIFDVLTLGGAVKNIYNIFRSTPKSFVASGASKTSGYFTQKAIELGYLSSTTVARNQAGIWVQIHNNVPRLFSGKSIRMLYSSSAATTVGRQMLNNAYKNAAIQLFVGGASTINDFGN